MVIHKDTTNRHHGPHLQSKYKPLKRARIIS